MPRATITRQTGLNRSTVAALVGELVASRLVVESEPDPNRQVGRPSGMVMPALGPVALTVNPEIDAITVAAVALGVQVLRRRRLPLDCVPSADEAVRIAVDLFEQLISDLGDNHDVVGIGIGIGVAVPGLVRHDDGLVMLAPHLDWADAPFTRMLSEASGYPVRVANDASLGGLAECIILAGFLACLSAISPEVLDASLASQPLRDPRETATIRGAELGQNLLVIGAAEIVLESLLLDPVPVAVSHRPLKRASS